MAKKKTNKKLQLKMPQLGKVKIVLPRVDLLKKVLVIVLGLLILDLGIQAWFRSAVVAYSPKGIVVTYGEVFKKFKEEKTPTTLALLTQKIISEEIVLKEAKKRNITVTEDDINAYLKRLEQLTGVPVETLLAQTGLTEEEFKELLKLNILVDKLVNVDYEPTEEEIKKYYEENKEILFKDKSLDEVKEQIKFTLIEEKKQVEQNNWFLETLKEYDVTYFLDEKPSFKLGAGINYYLPVLINDLLDTKLPVPLISIGK